MLLHLFPESGFDQSAVTPVFIGVLVSWFFTETLGWVFAGLVVPGYLATLFVLDPRIATIDVAEAVLTYLVAKALGEHLSLTRLTSRAFGRERFLLILVVSVLVRIVVEGVTLPALVPHAKWAHSVGLVVVPLAANACWKTGLVRGFVQNGVPSLIVYLLLRFVLIPYTNISLGGFHLSIEDVAASFSRAPDAYVLLLTGAVLGAIANVRYGWDFGGILIPALLSLVVAKPDKLAATILEALLLVVIARLVLMARWTRRWNLEGPRRLVLFLTLDYAMRFGFAALLGRSIPGADVAELMGLGYLVPTLLAVKIVQRGSAAVVLLPTVTVSVVAFVLFVTGSSVAARLDGSHDKQNAGESFAAHLPTDPALAALWVSSLARIQAPAAAAPVRAPVFAGIVDALARGEAPRLPPGLAAQRPSTKVAVVRERFDDLERRSGEPAALVRVGGDANARLVAVVDSPHETFAAYVAGQLLERDAVDVVIIDGIELVQRRSGHGLDARILADELIRDPRRHGEVVLLHQGASDELRVHTITNPSHRLRTLVDDVDAVTHPRAVDSQTIPTGDADVELPVASDLAIAARPAPPMETTTALASILGEVGVAPASPTPSPEDILALRRLLLEPLLRVHTTTSISPVLRASADALGYELQGPGRLPDGDSAFVLVPDQIGSGALAIVARLTGRNGIVVEVPQGASPPLRAVGLRLFAVLRADALLVGLASGEGALGNAAFAEAHAVASWPSSGREPRLVVLHEDDLGAPAVSASGWGVAAPSELLRDVEKVFGDMGAAVHEGPASSSSREWAGRTVFGGTPLVDVGVPPRILHTPAFATRESALDSLKEFPLRDEACDALALELVAALPEGVDGPETLLDTARRAVEERSVTAVRALEALASSSARIAVARADSGIFLVVVGKHGRAVSMAAVPVALIAKTTPSAQLHLRSVAACARAISNGGACRVEAAP